nr:uncharacterized protein LOC112427012 [Macaca nemestrina]
MASCLVEGLKKAAYKVVNYDKLKETTQGKDENPAQFMARLAATLRRFTALDPEVPEGCLILNMHFITQSAPDIRKKLQKLESGPHTPQQELINLAFKVHNNREEVARQQHISEVQLLASAVRQPTTMSPAYKNFRTSKPQLPGAPSKHPHGPFFKCQKPGHWVSGCPQPRIPPKPCPVCVGLHWRSDCPIHIAAAPKAPGAQTQHSLADCLPDLLSLAAED